MPFLKFNVTRKQIVSVVIEVPETAELRQLLQESQKLSAAAEKLSQQDGKTMASYDLFKQAEQLLKPLQEQHTAEVKGHVEAVDAVDWLPCDLSPGFRILGLEEATREEAVRYGYPDVEYVEDDDASPG